jgi:hypothetical protein
MDADRGILEGMSSVPIDIPEATLVALKLDAANAAAELRMAARVLPPSSPAYLA